MLPALSAKQGASVTKKEPMIRHQRSQRALELLVLALIPSIVLIRFLLTNSVDVELDRDDEVMLVSGVGVF